VLWLHRPITLKLFMLVAVQLYPSVVCSVCIHACPMYVVHSSMYSTSIEQSTDLQLHCEPQHLSSLDSMFFSCMYTATIVLIV
jgi:hypothetical protein